MLISLIIQESSYLVRILINYLIIGYSDLVKSLLLALCFYCTLNKLQYIVLMKNQNSSFLECLTYLHHLITQYLLILNHPDYHHLQVTNHNLMVANQLEFSLQNFLAHFKRCHLTKRLTIKDFE